MDGLENVLTQDVLEGEYSLLTERLLCTVPTVYLCVRAVGSFFDAAQLSRTQDLAGLTKEDLVCLQLVLALVSCFKLR